MGHAVLSDRFAQPAVAHPEHTSATRRQTFIMRHQNQGCTVLGIQREHQINHLLPRVDVKVSSRFVGQNQLRIGRERTRQRNPLLLTTRQMFGPMMTTAG